MEDRGGAASLPLPGGLYKPDKMISGRGRLGVQDIGVRGKENVCGRLERAPESRAVGLPLGPGK